MDIQRELERDIGHGPVLPTPQQRLAAGRAALRRRRLAVAAGAAAVVVTIAAPFALTGSGANEGTDLRPAAPPVSPSVAEPSPDRTPRADRQPRFDRSRGEVAYVDVLTGELMIHPHAVVLQRVDDLFPGKATGSVALDLRLDGTREWVALEWDEGGSSGTYGGPEDGFYTGFDDFVAKATSGGGMTSGRPGRNPGDGDDLPVPGDVTGLTVEGERFVSDGTVAILEQQPSPDLPQGFALRRDGTAAAYVEQDGVRYLALSRPGELIVVESTGHGDSLDALLDWARDRYASGEGLL